MSAPAFVYVYGVTAAGVAVPPNVRAVIAGELQACVTDSDQLGPDPTAANLLAHQRLLEAIMAQATVVPFAFGTIMPEVDLVGMLERSRTELQELLAALAGKIEVGLKLIWKQEQFLADVATPAITARHKQLLGAPRRSEAALAELGELLQKAADARRDQYQTEIFDRLAAAAADAKLNDTAGPRMVLNAAFLVERSREPAFDALVGQVCQPHAERLDIRYTGPWPPFSFTARRLQAREGG